MKRPRGRKAKPNVYGLCPHCAAPVVLRERRVNGNDTCANGHVFPSAATRAAEPKPARMIFSCGVVPGHEHETEGEAWECIRHHTVMFGGGDEP